MRLKGFRCQVSGCTDAEISMNRNVGALSERPWGMRCQVSGIENGECRGAQCAPDVKDHIRNAWNAEGGVPYIVELPPRI